MDAAVLPAAMPGKGESPVQKVVPQAAETLLHAARGDDDLMSLPQAPANANEASPPGPGSG
jgi:hypothetical protein